MSMKRSVQAMAHQHSQHGDDPTDEDVAIPVSFYSRPSQPQPSMNLGNPRTA
jgi:hypothetical protein